MEAIYPVKVEFLGPKGDLGYLLVVERELAKE